MSTWLAWSLAVATLRHARCVRLCPDGAPAAKTFLLNLLQPLVTARRPRTHLKEKYNEMHREEVDAVKTKGGDRRKSCRGMLIPLRTDSASYVWGPQHVGFPSHCDGTQDTEPAQQCHCLAFRTAVCCNQKEKKKKKCRWGLFLEPGAGVWEHDWSRGLDLGERASERAGGPAGARGPGSAIGSGPTCFVM